MTRETLNREYFEWMCQLIYDPAYPETAFDKLLHRLDHIDFYYSIAMDANREADGIDLRYRFAYERGYGDAMIASLIDIRPCSVLEMMVALANRCEEQIMDDPDIGDRTGQWFWNMIINLGLDSMDDKHYDETYVNKAVSRFLNRKYAKNGSGGLFTIANSREDLRQAEIWYQMCWYLDEIL